MGTINQLVTKGIDLVTKHADDAIEIMTSSRNVAPKINSAFTASKLECKKATKLMQRASKANAEKMMTVLKASEKEISESFDLVRKHFLQKCEEMNIPQEIVKEIKEARTGGELNAALFNYENLLKQHYISPIFKKIKPKHLRSMPLEIEQMFYQNSNIVNENIIQLHRCFSKTSTEPISRTVETTLLTDYNIKAFLKNDPRKAQMVMEGVKKAAEKGLKMPNEIIISDYLSSAGRHIATRNGEYHTLIIDSTTKHRFMQKCPKVKYTEEQANLIQKWKESSGFNSWSSTRDRNHIMIHEILHAEHLPLLAFKFKPIPHQYDSTIRQLSGYAASKPTTTHEVFTELNTKYHLEELSDSEMSLFKFLGGLA